jgi:hypothetical protein
VNGVEGGSRFLSEGKEENREDEDGDGEGKTESIAGARSLVLVVLGAVVVGDGSRDRARRVSSVEDARVGQDLRCSAEGDLSLSAADNRMAFSSSARIIVIRTRDSSSSALIRSRALVVCGTDVIVVALGSINVDKGARAETTTIASETSCASSITVSS